MGRTVFLMAAFGGRPEILQKLWESTNKNVTTEEICNKILSETESNKRLPGTWHPSVIT